MTAAAAASSASSPLEIFVRTDRRHARVHRTGVHRRGVATRRLLVELINRHRGTVLLARAAELSCCTSPRGWRSSAVTAFELNYPETVAVISSWVWSTGRGVARPIYKYSATADP